jgi:hypothetical protein
MGVRLGGGQARGPAEEEPVDQFGADALVPCNHDSDPRWRGKGGALTKHRHAARRQLVRLLAGRGRSRAPHGRCGENRLGRARHTRHHGGERSPPGRGTSLRRGCAHRQARGDPLLLVFEVGAQVRASGVTLGPIGTTLRATTQWRAGIVVWASQDVQHRARRASRVSGTAPDAGPAEMDPDEPAQGAPRTFPGRGRHPVSLCCAREALAILSRCAADLGFCA